METLYKRTSTGAIQEWHRELDGNRYRSVSGQVGGSKVESGWVVCEGKNKGKANETSGVEQAKLECEAAYTKKLAQGGYKRSVDDIDTHEFVKPMLAKVYEDYPVTDFDSVTVYSQPKYDGVRCIATKDGLFTRQGKVIEAVPHISEALAPIFAENPDAVFDGELYADKLSDDFNKIISLVRKKNPTPERLQEAADMIGYFVYDFPSHEGSFADRISSLWGALGSLVLGKAMCPIYIAPTHKLSRQEDMDELYSQYTRDGYEGQMIRVGTNAYENKRSRQLLKRKVFQDAEYEIVEIVEGQGNRSGMAGFITYKLEDGREFGSGIKGTHDFCRDLLVNADSYKGGTGTVKFFGLTPDGIPRFPVTVAVYEGVRDV